MISLRLPWPPSVNHYWGLRVVFPRARPSARRGEVSVRAAEYRALRQERKRWRIVRFIDKAGRRFRLEVRRAAGRIQALEGPLGCRIWLRPPDARERDVDNPLKAILDALQHAGCYASDSQIKELTVQMCSKAEGGEALVEIWRLSN